MQRVLKIQNNKSLRVERKKRGERVHKTVLTQRTAVAGDK